jgi:Na+/phosphate symporter
MTHEGMFNEYDDSIELKKLRKENNQLKKTIDILQTDNDIKDYEIQILKGKLNEQKNKNITR